MITSNKNKLIKKAKRVKYVCNTINQPPPYDFIIDEDNEEVNICPISDKEIIELEIPD